MKRGRKTAADRLPSPADLRAPWQIANAARCGCRGQDDMCPCQNDPDAFKPRLSADTMRALLTEGAADMSTPARLAWKDKVRAALASKP